jgi:hypothetical protein
MSMRRRRQERTYERRLATHFAAHAVMAREMGLVFESITVEPTTKSGTVVWKRATAHVAAIVDVAIYRTLVETDALVLLAGRAAEIVALGEPLADHDDVAEARGVLATLESADSVLTAWTTYLMERARAILRVQSIWTLVAGLADALLRVPHWSAADVDRLASMPPFDRSTRSFGDVPQPLPGTPPELLRPLDEELTISPAALETLEAVGIRTVWHLIHSSEYDLTGLRHVGPRTIEKIKAQLAARGWVMGMDFLPEETR